MEYRSIIQRIKYTVKRSKYPNFSQWRIGLTHLLNVRKKEWNNPPKWKYWKCDSLKEAEKIERYFIHRIGMQEGTGGDLSPHTAVYVYIFLTLIVN